MRKLKIVFFAAAVLFLVGCKKEIAKVEVTAVTIDKTSIEMVVDDIQSLTATIVPSNATDKNLSWSSSKADVAIVDQSGEVSAVSAGMATITVKSKNGKSASCIVNVKEKTVAVSSVSLDKSELSLVEGSDYTLVATVAPENATDKTLIWNSSDEAVATVDANGKVTALAVGEAVITAVSKQDASKSASCAVTVEALFVAVESVGLDKSEAQILMGATLQLVATITPVDATNNGLSWTSSNEAVATVSDNGLVAAVSEGETIITVTTADGGKTASCAISVLPVPITAIAINPVSTTIKEGQTQSLELVFTPASSTASKELQWASNDESVATVDQDGNVRGIREGETIIAVRLKSNTSITATCSVKVEKDLTLKGITLNFSTANLKEGATLQLEVIYNPTYAANKTVSWSSTNSAIATVDENGNVTAEAIGNATITATSQEGNYTASCELTVMEWGMDIYTLMSSYGTPTIYKNFEEYEYDYRCDAMYVANRDFYYTTDFRTKEIRKNGIRIGNFTNSAECLSAANNIVYLITCNTNVSPWGYSLYKYYSSGTSREIVIPFTGRSRKFYKVVANNADDVFVIGEETNSFNETNGKLWRISSREVITEVNFPSETYNVSVSDIIVDSRNQTWFVIQRRSNKNEADLYLDGAHHSVVNINNCERRSNGSTILISSHEGDVYIAYVSTTGITVLRNNSEIFTASIDSQNHYLRGMKVSSKGDVYYAVELYDNSISKYCAFVYKNDSVLYTATPGTNIYALDIME